MATVAAVGAVTAAVVARMPAAVARRVARYLGRRIVPAVVSTANNATVLDGPSPAHDCAAAAGVDGDAPTAAEVASLPTAVAWCLAPLVESARDPAPLAIRLHVVEDFAAAAVLAVVESLAGAALPCRAAAVLVVLASAAHALYVVAARPYVDRLEQAFAAGLATGQAALSGAAAAAAARPGQESHGALVAAAWLTVAVNALFYAQLLVLAAWEMHKLRRHLRASSHSHTAPPPAPLASFLRAATDDEEMTAPMLARANPLRTGTPQ